MSIFPITNILGVNISVTEKQELLKNIAFRLKQNVKTTIFTPNPEMIVEASKDTKFLQVLNSADINIADGTGLIFANMFLNKQSLTRITGRELMQDLLPIANQYSYKVFFLGASEEVNRLTVEKVAKTFPNIKVQGKDVPFLNREAQIAQQSDTSIYNETLSTVNSFSPDILFVALGAPKQEYWIYKNKSLNFKLAVGIGGSMDYFVGKSVVPPSFISRLGLEWIWRGLLEPKRFKRIFNAVVIFPVLVLKGKLLDNNTH